jgi:hypothetical protein
MTVSSMSSSAVECFASKKRMDVRDKVFEPDGPFHVETYQNCYDRCVQNSQKGFDPVHHSPPLDLYVLNTT